MASHEVKVPDIGNYSGVPVIEVLVKVGDTVAKDQGLVTLESDKATMEVPSSVAGVVKEIKVKLGDEIGEGAVVAIVDADGAAASAPKPTAAAPAAAKPETVAAGKTQASTAVPNAVLPPASMQSSPAPPGHPLPGAEGIANAKASIDTSKPTRLSELETAALAPDIDPEVAGPQASPPVNFGADTVMPNKVPHASPAVRLFARELGVDLSQVTGSERKGRITREDVQKFVKAALSGSAPRGAATGGGGLNLLPWPQVDFAKFGEIESKPLSKIKKISGANLARNWAMIPHVTQFDDADITDLEALRVELNKENEKAGIKLTMLAFLIKAVVSALKKYPEFNASLDASGENLVLKKYFHIGFAADTPNGLVVPVIRDADKKGVIDLARESGELAKKARDGKLGPADMSGGCFSISSLGGIGGTAFTPIVNAPEVSILGVSKSAIKPVWNGEKFKPRLILPLSLSYDHRVIDGASAARFTAYLAQVLADMRRVLL
ncbi:MAG: dihydrolipoyllysine-residue acetyltransferase [Gammaproteobacteria bacterium]|nr:MAG: dihydrolipoyllysine-residue acetyltransferase [Gammaproteobacteria bacterium]